MNKLTHFLAFLTPYGTHAYFMMFFVLIACGFGLPLPEDVVLLSGGILAAREVTHLWVVNVVCMGGVLLGDCIVFLLGRKFGAAIKNRGIFRRLINEKTDRRVMGIIQKYGDKVIFMARFMPGLRTPIFMTCGIYQVKFWKFILLDGAAALLSVPLWVYCGYIFGRNIEDLEHRIKQFRFGLYIALGAILIVFIVSIIIKRRTIKRMEA